MGEVSTGSGYWNSIEWTPEMCALLQKRREERHSAIKIGLELGLSDRAVKSQLTRMGMPTTLPPLETEAPLPVKPIVQLMRQATLPLPQPMPFAAPKTCQWPMWKDNEPPGLAPRFCGVRAQPGRPYCCSHWQKAHTPRVWLP